MTERDSLFDHVYLAVQNTVDDGNRRDGLAALKQIEGALKDALLALDALHDSPILATAAEQARRVLKGTAE